MNWISVKDKKPDHDCVAVVYNNKGWMGMKNAFYYKDYDVWKLEDDSIRDSILLDITHYIQLPAPPNQECLCQNHRTFSMW
jgi:hypothetical protein